MNFGDAVEVDLEEDEVRGVGMLRTSIMSVKHVQSV